jgi:hypothetical protein
MLISPVLNLLYKQGIKNLINSIILLFNRLYLYLYILKLYYIVFIFFFIKPYIKLALPSLILTPGISIALAL